MGALSAGYGSRHLVAFRSMASARSGRIALAHLVGPLVSPIFDTCSGPTIPTPLWNIVFKGHDDRGRAVQTTIDLRLPTDPASVVARRGRSEPVASTTKPAAPVTTAPTPAPTPVAPASTPQAALGATVPIQVLENLVLVPATLDRAQGATLLMDSGTQHTILTPALARRLKLTPDANASKRVITILGGQKIEVPFVRLPSLEIGDARVVDIEVGVHTVAPDLPIIDGLLGADILSRYRITIDHATRQLKLEAR